MKQGAQGWCTGITLRDGMEREVGGVPDGPLVKTILSNARDMGLIPGGGNKFSYATG